MEEKSCLIRCVVFLSCKRMFKGTYCKMVLSAILFSITSNLFSPPLENAYLTHPLRILISPAPRGCLSHLPHENDYLTRPLRMLISPAPWECLSHPPHENAYLYYYKAPDTYSSQNDNRSIYSCHRKSRREETYNWQGHFS